MRQLTTFLLVALAIALFLPQPALAATDPVVVLQFAFPYLLALGGALLAPWAHKHIKTQTDAARAATIAHVANDVAAAVYANNPNLRWLDLLKQATQQIEDAVPTSNGDVITRAATAALLRAGAKPQ